MRKLALLILFIILFSSGCFAYHNIPVLMYHNTDYVFSEDQALSSITPENFESHLKTFREFGYNSVSVRDYIKYTEGKFPLPANPFIITFDDGYTSNYTHAMPLLKKYKFNAAIFVVTGSVGASDIAFPHFDWQQAKELSDSGIIEIYSHTNSHGDLTLLTPAQIAFELRRSKIAIESRLGTTCDVFAAPFGKFSTEAVDCAIAAGYKLMMRVGDVCGDVPADGIISLKRHTVTGDMSALDVINMMESE
ncbi:MAG: polysaccharide deacetylase family protein [Monoglobales bacterium]